MSDIGLNSTGVYQHISTQCKIPDFDSRAANHFWMIIVSFAVNDPEKLIETGQGILDHENIVQVTPIICAYCAIEYSKREKFRRCTDTIPD